MTTLIAIAVLTVLAVGALYATVFVAVDKKHALNPPIVFTPLLNATTLRHALQNGAQPCERAACSSQHSAVPCTRYACFVAPDDHEHCWLVYDEACAPPTPAPTAEAPRANAATLAFTVNTTAACANATDAHALATALYAAIEAAYVDEALRRPQFITLDDTACADAGDAVTLHFALVHAERSLAFAALVEAQWRVAADTDGIVLGAVVAAMSPALVDAASAQITQPAAWFTQQLATYSPTPSPAP